MKERFPEEYMQPAVVRYYLYTYYEILAWLEKNGSWGKPQRHFRKAFFMFTEEQLAMARKKGVNTDGNTGSKTSGNASAGRQSVAWINVSLSDEDADFLAEATTGYGELAAMACEYVSSGYSLSIKPMDGGDSVMACIIGQSSDDPNVTVGLSGFASNVRDALLTLCYKFEDKLGGQLPLPDGGGNNNRPRFR